MKNVYLMFLMIGTAINSIAQQSTFESKYLKDGTYIFNDELKLTRATIFTNYKFEFGLNSNDEMSQGQTIVEGNNFHTK